MAFLQDQNIFFNFGAGDMAAKSARIASGATDWFDLGTVKEIVMQLDADGGTGTTPTLDVKFQTSYDATDATAIDVPSGAFTQVSAASSGQINTATIMHRYVKVIWTITGTTPSFNFGVYATSRN